MNNLKAQIQKTLLIQSQYALVNVNGSPYSRVIHPCQYKFIFRELYFQTYKEDPLIRPDSNKTHPTNAILKRLAFQKLNRNRYERMRLQSTPRHLAGVVVQQFYNKGHFSWWPVIHSVKAINTEALVDLLWGAIGPPRINSAWRTSNVISLLNEMRANENFILMPVLSDALEDAGCEDKNLITRLREASYFSLGDWLFKVAGLIG